MKYLTLKLKLWRVLKILFILLSLVLLNSCASVPNIPACFELAPVRAYCVYTVTGETFEINEQNKFENKTWWEQRHQMILLPVSSWTKIKAYILKMCKKHKCNKESKDIVNTVDKMVRK